MNGTYVDITAAVTPGLHNGLLNRAILLRNWPNTEEAVKAFAGDVAALEDARTRRALLGIDVAHAPAHRTPLFPPCQFLPRGLLPEMALLLELLPDPDRSGWGPAVWLYSPHAGLDNRQPAEVLLIHPAAVVEVAAAQFSGSAARDALEGHTP